MASARKILSNTGFQIVGKLLTAAVSIVILKIITKYLSISEYGQYSQIYDFLSYFAIISDLGLFTIAVREMSKNTAKVKEIIGNILSIRIIVAVLALILAVLMAFLIPKYSESKVALGVAIASIGVFLTIMQGTLSSVLQIYYKMHISAISLILGKLSTLIYVLYTVYFYLPNSPEQGFFHLILAGVIGSLVMLIFTQFFVSRLTKVRLKFDLKFWHLVILPSIPYGFALILNNIYLRINSLFIFFLRGEFEAGLYAVAMKIMEILAIIGLFFMNSVLPGLTKAIQEDAAHAKKIIQYAFDFLVMMSLPIITGIFTLSYPIIYLISKKEYLSSVENGVRFYGSDFALKVLIFAIFFQFLIALFSFILIAAHHQNQLLWINFSAVIFNVLASYFMVRSYGFAGGAFTSVVVEVVVMILMYKTAKKFVDFKISLGRFFKILISALTMGILITIIQRPLENMLESKAVIVLVGIGGGVYTIMLFATKALTKEMIKELKK